MQNIAVLDKHADRIAFLEDRTASLEGKVGVLEEEVDSLKSITNSMATQMFKLDRYKADKTALAAAETRISALEENGGAFESKISALEETQKQNIINTNASYHSLFCSTSIWSRRVDSEMIFLCNLAMHVFAFVT